MHLSKEYVVRNIGIKVESGIRTHNLLFPGQVCLMCIHSPFTGSNHKQRNNYYHAHIATYMHTHTSLINTMSTKIGVVSWPVFQQHSLQPLTHWAVRHLPPSHTSSPHTPLLCTYALRNDVETSVRASRCLSSRERFSPWTCCTWSIWKCSVRQELFAVS